MFRTNLVSSMGCSFCCAWAQPLLHFSLPLGPIIAFIPVLNKLDDGPPLMPPILYKPDGAPPPTAPVTIEASDDQSRIRNSCRNNLISSRDTPTEARKICRLQSPKSGRLLPGAGCDTLQPGLRTLAFQELELCVDCPKLLPGPVLRTLKCMRGRVNRWATITFAVLYEQRPANGDSWQETGRTEIISHDESKYRFVTKFRVTCGTTEERNKPLRVEVYQFLRQRSELHARNMIGAVEFSAGDLLSEPLSRKDLMLRSSRGLNTGCLHVSANPVRPPCTLVKSKKIHFVVALSPATSPAKGNHDAFFVLLRQLPSGEYTAVYRSEVIGRGTERFEEMIADVVTVTGGGADDTPLRLELYQFNAKGKHTQLGFARMSVENLHSTAIGEPLMWWTYNQLNLMHRSVRFGRSWGIRQTEVERVVLVEKSVDSARSKFGLEVR